MESDVILKNVPAGLVLQVLVGVKAMVKRVKRTEGQMEIKEKMGRVE